ncbi:hypothetical protein [Secundilactobacillus kimchicus]|uniref:hypothetical protein n=1 Tax=Secundilactobacillus kimchicus TaxID=528209 RepID=UPI0024A9B7E2|nr:hypothetical protein [Secundilactobacillus kimchicus]
MTKQNESKTRHNVIIDMNDFILEYAARRLGNKNDLAETVYNAAKNDLKGLDTLFNDQGEAREHVYTAVAEGFISDDQPALDQAQAKQAADKMAVEAMGYLGSHLSDFDRWKNN